MSKLDEKVFEIVQLITEEWAKRTADHEPPVTSVQIVLIAESVIATKMFHMLEGLEKTAASPDESKVVAIRVDWQQEMEWGLEELRRTQGQKPDQLT